MMSAHLAAAAEEKRQAELNAKIERAKKEIQEKAAKEWHGGKRHRVTAKRFFGRVKKVKSQKKKGSNTQKRRRA